MTHILFRRRENQQSCEICREIPAGPPCYDCTFGLQTPPPRYNSVKNSDAPSQQNSSLPLEEHPEFEVASLAEGVSRIGMAVALAINPSHTDTMHLTVSHALARTRHWSDQTTKNTGHVDLARNASAPQLQFLDIQVCVCVCVCVCYFHLITEQGNRPWPSTLAQ